MYDVAIAGGGPAGLSLALMTARRGLRTVVMERRTLPCDKPCGEGLMPRGVAALEAMGVRQRLPDADAAEFRGIRYVQEDGTTAEGRFMGGVGLGIRRVALSTALLEGARGAGAEILDRTPVTGFVREEDAVFLQLESGESVGARMTVAADGLVSPLRRIAGLERASRSPKRFGMRRHFRLRPWSPFVEVHFTNGVEAYVTPAGRDRVGIAFLWEEGRVDGRISYDALLERFPRLQERVAGAAPDSDVQGAGPLERVAAARVADRFALLGDAAGYVDALTGEGLSLSFACAEALANLLPLALDQGATAASLQPYEAAVARVYRPYQALTYSLLAIARRPLVRRTVIRVLSRCPRGFDRILGALTA